MYNTRGKGLGYDGNRLKKGAYYGLQILFACDAIDKFIIQLVTYKITDINFLVILLIKRRFAPSFIHGRVFKSHFQLVDKKIIALKANSFNQLCYMHA